MISVLCRSLDIIIMKKLQCLMMIAISFHILDGNGGGLHGAELGVCLT